MKYHHLEAKPVKTSLFAPVPAEEVQQRITDVNETIQTVSNEKSRLRLEGDFSSLIAGIAGFENANQLHINSRADDLTRLLERKNCTILAVDYLKDVVLCYNPDDKVCPYVSWRFSPADHDLQMSVFWGHYYGEGFDDAYQSYLERLADTNF